MTFARLALAASLLALLGASLPGKLALRDDASDPLTPLPVEAAAAQRLEAAGWVSAGVLALTENGAYRAHAFETERCDGVLLLSAIRPNGEADQMLAELAGEKGLLFFVQGGRARQDLPHLRAALDQKLGRLWQRLGLADPAVSHEVLAVVVTEGCVGERLPW